MPKNFHKKQIHTDFDKSTTFIEIKSEYSKHSELVSVEDLLSTIRDEKHEKYDIRKDIDKLTLVLDPSTKKAKVNFSLFKTSNVFSSPYNEDNINYNLLPRDASEVSGMHLMANENYLYIWVGTRWKRVPLSEW